jgi:putative endonuclease
MAAAYLRQRGYTILHRNYRSRSGEIDIIARHGKALVFAEVKTRRTMNFGSPAAAVTLRKQRQISRVAEEYLARENLFDSEARFDVISVLAPQGKEPVVEIIPNAFDLYRYG